MISEDRAREFAREWIAAWNAHDLDSILAHYEDDFEMSSPIITQLMGDPSGTLKGKAAIASYWALALARNPQLQFELLHVLPGANSIAVIYNGVRGLSAEIFHFGSSGRVAAAYAHYLSC